MKKLIFLPLTTLIVGVAVAALSSPIFLSTNPSNQLVIKNYSLDSHLKIQSEYDGTEVTYTYADWIKLKAAYATRYNGDSQIYQYTRGTHFENKPKVIINSFTYEGIEVTPQFYNIREVNFKSGKFPCEFFDLLVSEDLLQYVKDDTIGIIDENGVIMTFNVVGIAKGTKTVIFSNQYYNYGNLYINPYVRKRIESGYLNFEFFPYENSPSEVLLGEETTKLGINDVTRIYDPNTVLELPSGYFNGNEYEKISVRYTMGFDSEIDKTEYVDIDKIVYDEDVERPTLILSPDAEQSILSNDDYAPNDALLIYDNIDDYESDKNNLLKHGLDVKEVPIEGTYYTTNTVALSLSTLLFLLYIVAISYYLSFGYLKESGKLARMLTIGITSVLTIALFTYILLITPIAAPINTAITLTFGIASLLVLASAAVVIAIKKKKKVEEETEVSEN